MIEHATGCGHHYTQRCLGATGKLHWSREVGMCGLGGHGSIGVLDF